MSATQRLMLSGPGLIGRTHARIIRENEACDLAAIVAPDTEENRSVAKEFNAAFHSDFDAALDAERIDGVIISSPNPFHFSQAMTCVKRGLPA
jgi:predicted dehydrogenase